MRSFTSILPPGMVSFDLTSHNFSKREIFYNFPKIHSQKLLCQPILPKITTPPGPFCTYVSWGCPWTRSSDHASIKLKRYYLGPRGWPLFVLSFRWIRARNLKFGRTFQNTLCTKFVPGKDWEWADHGKILN